MAARLNSVLSHYGPTIKASRPPNGMTLQDADQRFWDFANVLRADHPAEFNWLRRDGTTYLSLWTVGRIADLDAYCVQCQHRTSEPRFLGLTQSGYDLDADLERNARGLAITLGRCRPPQSEITYYIIRPIAAHAREWRKRFRRSPATQRLESDRQSDMAATEKRNKAPPS